MAFDIASRIKARFAWQRRSTVSSPASSRSGLAESSLLTGPSQSSREPSFLSEFQMTASQTHKHRDHTCSETPSQGTTSDVLEEEGSHDDEKGRLSLLHVRRSSNSTAAAAGATPHVVDSGQSPAKTAGASRVTVTVTQPQGLPEQALQACQLSPPAPSPAANVDQVDLVQPRHGPGRAIPASRPQQATQSSSVRQPPLSQSTPSPSTSPRAPTAKTVTFASSDCPLPPLKESGISQFRNTTILGSLGASASAGSAADQTKPIGDDAEIDPLLRSHHGPEPDRLSFASHLATNFEPALAVSQTPTTALGAAADRQSSRRQSLFAGRQTSLSQTLLLPSNQLTDSADIGPPSSIDTTMVSRKIWVKRAHASATTIAINEDDLVDDVRDMILRKYANSLGRTFDSPDLVIRLHPRDQGKERTLGPEEVMAHTLDAYYPGGQSVDEALIIDIPRKTPRASPLAPIPPGTTTYYVTDDGRPSEAGEGYFPPVISMQSPNVPHSGPVAPNGPLPHSIAVLGTGHIAPVPSPGGTRTRMHRERSERPRLGRTLTSSPTITAGHTSGMQTSAAGSHNTQNFVPRLPHSRTHSSSSDHPTGGLPAVKPTLPKSPAPEPKPARVATPPPRAVSPRASSAIARRSKKIPEYLNPANILNGSVPPINVLIVEDNPINLKLLEAFVKKLKVRWQTAMNGKDAVDKWKNGGFHLVLMDIQLPVMNGLDATREIRRLERVNSIGVFSSTDGDAGTDDSELKEQDRLQSLSLFKSPVIIVALTASSLQSDRHEALAAGCNDFLTKPVNFVWLERKVMEWGCMQALIDFDGWRKWKEAYSQQNNDRDVVKKAQAAKTKTRKGRSASGVAT